MTSRWSPRLTVNDCHMSFPDRKSADRYITRLPSPCIRSTAEFEVCLDSVSDVQSCLPFVLSTRIPSWPSTRTWLPCLLCRWSPTSRLSLTPSRSDVPPPPPPPPAAATSATATAAATTSAPATAAIKGQRRRPPSSSSSSSCCTVGRTLGGGN